MVLDNHTKLLNKKHSGKLRPHRHTSYGSLALILLLAFVPLLIVSRPVAAEDNSNNQTYAVVPGAIPKTAPVITAPAPNKVFTSADPITVKGQCPVSTLVKIYKNEIMGGATFCQNGIFSIPVDLFAGNNTLVARAYNANDLPGPDSSPVVVKSLVAGISLQGSEQLNAVGAPANQFYLTSEISYRGSNPGDTMTWPLILTGGQSPYAVQISWGDGKTDLISRGAVGRFDISHTYNRPASYSGSYTIVIKASDQSGNKSYLQLVAIVSGDVHPVGLAGAVGGGSSGSTMIRAAWMLFAGLIVAVLGFWLGEKREKLVLNRQRTRTV